MLLSDSSKEQGKSKKRIHTYSDTRRLRTSGIGVIVFGAIFCYFVFMMISGFLRSRVETYEVMEGSLTENLTFTGFAVREETCVEAVHPDSLLLVRENEKIAKGSVLFADQEVFSEAGNVSADAEAEIGGAAETFLFSFSERNFSTVYSFKRELLHIGAAVYQTDSAESLKYSSAVITAPCDGIASTAIDGYEGTTVSDVMAPDFSWTVKNTGETANSVKIVSSEEWFLIIPVTDKQVITLSNLTRAKVTFLGDGETEQASVKWLRTEDGRSFLSLSFKSGLIRYLKDRFISVRIEESQEKGLKVPVSAIARETFFEIPSRCRFLSGGSSGVHFMLRKQNPDGTFLTDARGDVVTELISPTIYYRRQDEEDHVYYYVSPSELSAGDTLAIENTDETYTVEASAELTGVYQVNNGYAIFRCVEILDKNDMWCLVKKGTDRGIVQHDFIVYDSSEAKDSMILTR